MAPHVNSINLSVEVRQARSHGHQCCRGLLCRDQYRKGILKGDKDNLRCKYNNFKFDCDVECSVSEE